jgi:predicted aspartyl protease
VVVIEEEEFMVEVLGGNELVNVLLGVLWLRTKRLVVDFPMGVLTLG